MSSLTKVPDNSESLNIFLLCSFSKSFRYLAISVNPICSASKDKSIFSSFKLSVITDGIVDIKLLSDSIIFFTEFKFPEATAHIRFRFNFVAYSKFADDTVDEVGTPIIRSFPIEIGFESVLN